MKVSAVLLSWRRPFHIPVIANHLRQFPEVEDITCWSNEHPPTPEISAACDTVIHSPENKFTLGRFLASKSCQCGHIYVQDDDLLVHNVPQLVAQYRESGCDQIVANLVDDKSSRHWTWWQTHCPAWIELGFGSVFPREWSRKLEDWPYDRQLLARKADKVFSVLNPWRAVRCGADEITRLFHNGQESGRDAHALSRRADHQRLTGEAVRLAEEWKAALERADREVDGARDVRGAVAAVGAVDCGRGG